MKKIIFLIYFFFVINVFLKPNITYIYFRLDKEFNLSLGRSDDNKILYQG